MNNLVLKAQNHDKEAFSQLIKAYTASMYKVAIAILKNDDNAADAIGETILTCWEKLPELRREDYFKTWLIRILINKCNIIYNQNKRMAPLEEVQEMSSSDTLYEIEWLDTLDRLAPKYREVIVLYYGERFKIREISQILNISESLVKKRLVKARESISGFYSDRKEYRVI